MFCHSAFDLVLVVMCLLCAFPTVEFCTVGITLVASLSCCYISSCVQGWGLELSSISRTKSCGLGLGVELENAGVDPSLHE